MEMTVWDLTFSVYCISLQHPQADVSEPKALVSSDDKRVVTVSTGLNRTTKLRGEYREMCWQESNHETSFWSSGS